MIQVFQRPESVPIHAEVRNWEGTLTNPTHGIKITVTNPAGTVKVDDVSMGDPVVTGKYVYYYDSSPKGEPPVDDPVGWWRYKVTTQDGSGADAKYTLVEGAFELK